MYRVFQIIFLLACIQVSSYTLFESYSTYVQAAVNKEEMIRKEIPKYYPFAQVLFIQKVWEKKTDKNTIEHYVVTIQDRGKQLRVNVTLTLNSKREVKRIQVLKQ